MASTPQSKTSIASIASNTKTSFLTLPSELRQAIIRDTYDENELIEATQQIKDRFLTWDDLFDEHELHLEAWVDTLKEVHVGIADDVEYIGKKWQKNFVALVDERIDEYEAAARKRRAQFLLENPRVRC
jgi:hypothetical protein